MQIKATYNQGRLEFSAPIRLNRDEFPVMVDLPDEVVLPPEADANKAASAPSSEAPGAELLAKVRAIVGPMRRQRPSASVEDDKEAYAQALGEKYGT